MTVFLRENHPPDQQEAEQDQRDNDVEECRKKQKACDYYHQSSHCAPSFVLCALCGIARSLCSLLFKQKEYRIDVSLPNIREVRQC